MGDLSDRLRALDEVREPDLWTSIRYGTPTRTTAEGEPRVRKRLLVAALALGVAAAAGLSVFRWSAGTEREFRRPGGHPVVVSAVSKDGTLRCTATIPSDIVQPGLRPGVRFELRNLSHHSIRYGAGSRGGVVVKDQVGKVIWDTRQGESVMRGPGLTPTLTLPAGGTALIPASEPRIWWSGRLTLEVSCLGLALGTIPARVDETGSPTSPDVALDRALERTRGLFDGCHPEANSSWINGAIQPPDGADIPPLPIRCSARIVRHSGFATVSIYFVSPPDAPTVQFPDTIYQLSNFDSLPGTGSIEAGRWLFVVTRSAVREVRSLDTVFRLRGGNARAPQYVYSEGRWSSGHIICDAEGFGGGVLFISVCPL